MSISVCGIKYKRLKQKTSENVYVNSLRSRKKHETKKAYILYSDIFEEVNTEYIILFDIETDTYKTIEIPSAYCAEIKFAYVDSGILYMVSKSGSIIKIIV